MGYLEKAILRTLAYADVFDYPLKKKEIYQFLISKKQVPKSRFQKELFALSPKISKKDGFYFLKGRGEIVALRKRRQGLSQEKLVVAQKTARWLRFVPTIKMVALTGALAMNNSDKDDDIDFLIVASANRLWLTRFLTVLLTEIVACRRRPGDKDVRDKICLNMFLDEKYLSVPKKEQDLFTAHEVCQLKPLWDREGVYQKFLKANQWVGNFLPNWHCRTFQTNTRSLFEKKGMGNKLLDCLELLVRKAQLFYMAPRRTTEVVGPHRIRFHSKDSRRRVLKEYQERLKSIGTRIVK